MDTALTLSPLLERALIYVAIAAAAAAAFTNWRRGDPRTFREPLMAFFALWFMYGGLFAAAANPTLLPQPLVYGLDFAAIILLSWGFLAASFSQRARSALIAIGLTLTGALSAFSISLASTSGIQPIWIGSVWSIGSVLASGATALLLFFLRHRNFRGDAAIAAFGTLALSSALGLLQLTDLAAVCHVIGFYLFPLAIYQNAISDLRSTRETLREFSDSALKQTQELVTLIEASTFLFSTFDRDELLRSVLEQAAVSMEFDQAIVATIDEDHSASMRVIRSFPVGKIARGHHFSIEQQPALKQVLQSGEALILGARTLGRSELARLLHVDQIGRAIIQPLVTPDDTIGLFIVHAQKGLVFSQGQTRLLEALATQIATAIENGRLYDRINAQAKELARLLADREQQVHWRDSILASIGDGIILADKSDSVILVNAAAAHLLDTPHDKLLGQSLGAIFDRLQPLNDRLPAGASPRADTVSAIFKLGQRILFAHMTPMHGLQGERDGMLTILRDATPEHEAAQAHAEFLDRIAREFRLPLQSIDGYADLLAKSADALPNTVRGFVDTIRSNAQRLDAQMRAVIRFNDLEQGRIELHIEETDIAPILAYTVTEYRPRLAARGLQLHLNIARDLPTLRADRARVQEVLDLLLDNAIKFTPHGGEIRLLATLSWDGQSITQPAHIAVSVADNGAGFDRSEAERFFDRFYRAQSPNTDAHGLGIGLPIARGLCEAMGGHLWAEGEKGRGATFTFILPIARPLDHTTAPGHASALESWIEEALSFPDDTSS